MKLSIAPSVMLRLMIVILNLAPPLLVAEVAYISEDHLVPRNPSIDGALRPVLEKKLLLTPADCALVIIRPPETGEVAVAVYRRRFENTADSFVVTVTQAKRNIDMTANVESLDAANKIGIVRCDAEIAKTAALAIRAAWRVMLARAKEPRFYARQSLHREEFEFSIKREGQLEMFATIPKKGGRSVSSLVELAKQLRSYCGAPIAARNKTAKKIEHDAKRLVAIVEGERN